MTTEKETITPAERLDELLNEAGLKVKFDIDYKKETISCTCSSSGFCLLHGVTLPSHLNGGSGGIRK